MDKQVAAETAKQRKLTRLKPPDAIQLAFAICHDLQLATRNSKDVTTEKFAFVLIPYQLLP